MRYLVTGGSGYIGSRLVERLGEREDTERILIADVRPPRSFRPKTEWAELDVRDGAATRDARRPRAPGCARPPRLRPEPDQGRAAHVRHRRQRHAQRARGGVARGCRARARHVVHDRIRRVPRQPGADHRGLAGARRRGVRVRARQDRVGPAVPALGAASPGAHDDDRPAVHRVRPERGQLPRPHSGPTRRSSPTSAATSTS